jgi:hypothetical protein
MVEEPVTPKAFCRRNWRLLSAYGLMVNAELDSWWWSERNEEATGLEPLTLDIRNPVI